MMEKGPKKGKPMEHPKTMPHKPMPHPVKMPHMPGMPK